MGVVSPIAALGVVVPVLAGLAQGERPAAWQLVGIVVAIAGVVLASGPELSGRAGARPVLLAAVAAVGFGVALLAIAKGSQHSTLMTLTTMRVTSVTCSGPPCWWPWPAAGSGPTTGSAAATSRWSPWSASRTWPPT